MSTQKQIAQELRNFKWIGRAEQAAKSAETANNGFTLDAYLRRYHRAARTERLNDAELQINALQSNVRRLQAFNSVLIALLIAALVALVWIGGGHG